MHAGHRTHVLSRLMFTMLAIAPASSTGLVACDDPPPPPDDAHLDGSTGDVRDDTGDDGGPDSGSEDVQRDAGAEDGRDLDGPDGDDVNGEGPGDAADLHDAAPPHDSEEQDTIRDDAAPEDVGPPEDVDVGPDAGTGCGNQMMDGDETDVDCGGSCEPCSSTSACLAAEDCATGICTDGVCEPWRATRVSVGDGHACAIVQEGRVICWGNNHLGQAGADPSASPTRLPGYVGDAGMRDVTGLSAGGAHTCAVRGDDVLCWGDNTRAQLGAETASDHTHVPTEVPRTGLASGAVWAASDVAAGRRHTCAIARVPGREDQVMCWGDNEAGQMGRFGPDADASAPSPVLTQGATPLRGPFDVLQAGDDHTCVVADVVDASGLGREALQCWGANDMGQLGGGATGNATPVVVNYSGSFIAASTGFATTCWVKREANQTRTLSCIGFIPANNYAASATAVRFDVWADAVDVAVDKDLVCAIHGAERAVACVGFPQALGYSLTAPTAIEGFDAPTDAIDAGTNFVCGTQRDGDIRCWGANEFGQLGRGPGPGSPRDALRVTP